MHLAVAARAEGVTPEDVDAALYDDRSVVKQLAMRRTLFVFPRELLPAAWGSASARVATSEGKRIAKAIAAGGIAARRGGVARRRPRRRPSPAWRQGRRPPPSCGPRSRSWPGRSAAPPTRPGTGPCSVAPWVLTHLGLEGRCSAGATRVTGDSTSRPGRPPRTGSASSTSRSDEAPATPRWCAGGWPRSAPAPRPTSSGGSGSTKTAVTRALADLGRRGGRPRRRVDRLGAAPATRGDRRPAEPWAALLPTLDPTVMGWKSRAFYLPPDHVPYLFDTNGNAGTTAWWDGRIVGLLGAGRGGRGPAVPARGRRRRGHRRPRARGPAADRLARRHRDRRRLRLAADEESAPALTGTYSPGAFHSASQRWRSCSIGSSARSRSRTESSSRVSRVCSPAGAKG